MVSHSREKLSSSLAHKAGALVVITLALAATSLADQERTNTPHVTASQYGNCYAKGVPATPLGSQGKTTVFLVEMGADKELYSFAWFAQRIYIECWVANAEAGTGPAVVRLGPWSRGHLATRQDLAIAFYWDGRLAKRYSTLDLAGEPENVSSSVSHYQVIREVEGFKRRDDNRYSFVVRTVDDRILEFDAATGDLLCSERIPARASAGPGGASSFPHVPAADPTSEDEQAPISAPRSLHHSEAKLDPSTNGQCSKENHTGWWQGCVYAILDVDPNQKERAPQGGGDWPVIPGRVKLSFLRSFAQAFVQHCETSREAGAASSRSSGELPDMASLHDVSRCPCTLADHTAFVEECLADVEAIVPGMMRSMVMKRFLLDGGVSFGSSTELVHPDCRMLKVRVSFDIDSGGTIDPNDLATAVGQPYVEYKYGHSEAMASD